MACQQVAFEQGRCLVEIESKPSDPQPRFTAFMSVVEEDGAVVRPLVSPDGRRVRIHATSESLALDSALTYLEKRFGAARDRREASALGHSTIGWPLVVTA